MVTITEVLIYHDLNCKRDFPIVGDKKLQKFKTKKVFQNEKEVRKYWNRLSLFMKIPRINIDFYTIGDSCILK